MEKEKICLRCMRKIGNREACPYCAGEESASQEAPFLPLKTVVAGRYLIGKAVSSNGDGITYNAFDLELKKPISLREFYPTGLVSRGEGSYCLVNVGSATEFIDAKNAFIKLWDKLARLKGYTALTPVLDVFEDLGTVYAVTEFLGEGKTLREYLLEKEQGYISWDEARILFMPVISALGELHAAGIIHGAITPTNLIIDINGRMRITGYSIADVRVENSGLEGEIIEGYAAVEQYGLSGVLSPATDIYGFAAVLYRALIGSTPISSATRLANDRLMIPGKFAEQLPAYVINALVNALQILPEDRTQRFDELRDELSASPIAQANSVDYEELVEDTEDVLPLLDEEDEYEEAVAPKKKNPALLVAISAGVSLLVLVLAILGIKLFSGDNNDDTSLTTDAEETTLSSDDDTSVGAASINLPDFTGDVFEDIKNDDKYKNLLKFETDYVDSELERGKVISQSINAGTVITELNPRTIVLKISNGLEVPNAVGEPKDDVVTELKKIGFKNVRAESTKIATSLEESGTVYSIVYEDPQTGKWAELPGDRRLSSGDTLIIYYYGEYKEPTQATTEPETEAYETLPYEEPTDESTQAETLAVEPENDDTIV